jgi:hypothetical protein
MPKSPTAASEAAVETVIGLHRLVRWLDDHHTDIPVARIEYATNEGAELTLESGGFDMLAVTLRAADELVDPEIVVADASSIDGQRHWCQLTVTGDLVFDDDTAIRVTVAGICYDDAADALRNSLGTPSIPGEHWWNVTSEHLHSLLPAGGAR